MFTLSSNKLNRTRNIGKFFSIYSSWAHLPPALQYTANLMQGTWFYCKLKFSLEILKRLHKQGISQFYAIKSH